MEVESVPESAPTARRFGPAQGLLLIGGMVLASLAGSVLAGFGWGIGVAVEAGVQAANAGGTAAPPPIPTPGTGLLAACVLLGGLFSAGWAVGYPLYAGRSLLKLGRPQGLGWRGASPNAYWVAASLAVMVAAVAWGLTRLIPPDPAQLTGPLEQLARSRGWPRAALLVLGLGIAPATEEFAFRGAVLAAFAGRFGTMTGVVVSTALFVLLHAADKIHYWPGFIDVGLMGLAAAGVRLRYGSVRPAMLLHFLYNAMLLVVPAAFASHHG
jgi:membrane protease YdiL (CAAX protease family)